MQFMIRGISGFFILIVLATSLHAQEDGIKSIEQIYNAYNNAQTIHFTGNLKMYAKHEPGKIIERMQSSYIIKGGYFDCQIGPVQMLLNDNYYVSADNTDKLIMIGRKKDLSAAEGVPVLNLDQFKRLLKEKKMLASASTRGAAGILQFTDMTGIGGFSKYTIEYNISNGYMKKVTMELSADTITGKALVLEINYTEPVIVEKNSSLFSEKKFFSIKNNKIQVTAAYKNYQIINQL